MSGGQQQRVALARALVYSPTVLLLDEPLSNLDAKLREQARAWLKRLQVDLGITTVYVTHDQDEALALSDRIAVMSGGGCSRSARPTEIYETPATAEVAAFVGRCNFLEASVSDVTATGAVVALAATGQAVTVDSDTHSRVGQTVTVAIRPEKLRICPPGQLTTSVNTLDTEVLTVSYLGSRYEYDVKLGDHVVQVVSDRRRADRAGAAVASSRRLPALPRGRRAVRRRAGAAHRRPDPSPLPRPAAHPLRAAAPSHRPQESEIS